MKRTISGLILALLLCGTALAAKAAVTNQVPIWFYLTANLANTNAEHNPFAHSLLDRAAAAGYSGMVLADSWLYFPDCGGATYRQALQPFLAHAQSVGITVVPLIYAYGEKSIIPLNKNFAEPLPVVGAGFTVSPDKQSLVFSNSLPVLTDMGFENHSGNRFVSWNYQDAVGTRTFADTNVFRSGACSYRIGPGNVIARVYKTNVPVNPWRQYHVGVWMCTSNFSGSLPDVIVTSSTSGRYLTYNNYGSRGVFSCSTNQPWTQYNFFFNSQTNTLVNIFVGDWGTTSGDLYFDDLVVEETALMNLVRRTGAPLSVYDASNTNVFYTETNDLNTISDPAVPTKGYGGQFTPWHTPPAVTLPAGTSLTPGQQVKMNYYAAIPVYASQVGACFTAPGIAEYMASNAAAVASAFPSNTGFMMNYDENRHLNNCESCRAMGLTAGGLIGWHAGQAINTIRSVRPEAPIYVWNDMFDPFHNAISGYYYFCNGPTADSWTGLPSTVIIMNWNHINAASMSNSLAFFSGRGHTQFIAGYYDSGNGRAAASNELKAVQGLAGFQGLMYTTFAGTNGYKQMENYAAAAKAPTVTAAPTNLSINVGQFASFSVSATAPTPLTFQWQRNGADIADATNASYACLASAADNGAQIACRVSDYGGWVLTDSATLTVADATTDSDSDGIPDWWMRIQFGHATGRSDDLSRAQDDADGDHATTWQEYMAGTDPTNSASCFGIVGISNAVPLVSAGPVIRWTSVTGKFYRVERATNLHLWPPFDLTVLSNLTATPPENTATDTTATGTGPYFYRILVE